MRIIKHPFVANRSLTLGLLSLQQKKNTVNSTSNEHNMVHWAVLG
jgi:hypothetical protein